MFWTLTKRILRSGATNFMRNSFVSLSTVLVMTVTLIIISAVIFLSAILDSTLSQIKDKVDVNVYFVTSAEENEIFALQERISQLPGVSFVEYTSREQALLNFRDRYRDDQLTLQALDELGDNPLGASLSIKAQEPSQYEAIAQFLTNEPALSTAGTSIIDKVNYFQNKLVIDRLTLVINASERIGFVVILIFIIASITIAFNTIRLAIYTARDEIGVMRLMGAQNMYIRGPFVIEGMLYGALAAVITLVLLYPTTLWIGPKTADWFGGLNLFSYYIGNLPSIFLMLVGSCLVLGGVSSYLAVRKYLTI